MATVSLRDAKAGFSSLVDDAINGEIVTITRHGKPVAALVSVEAAEIACKALERKRTGLVSYLRHSRAKRSSAIVLPREISSFERLSSRHQHHLHDGAIEGGDGNRLPRLAGSHGQRRPHFPVRRFHP